MITNEELLAAVRSAGEPGSESHRLACRLYRRSVIEWHAGTDQALRERSAEATVREYVAMLAALANAAGWLDEPGGCGTHGGYNQHAAEKTEACPACLAAEAKYSRNRKRARKLAAAENRWREAA